MFDLRTSIPALLLFGAIVVPLAIYLLLGAGERLLAGLRPSRGNRLRPALWLGLPCVLICVILLYPLASTVVTAFTNGDSSGWVGMQNFVWALTGEMQRVLGTTLVWVVVLPLATVVMAVVVGVLLDRIRYEKLAITILLLPTAISFTAGAIIWRQQYSYQPAGKEQLGLLNALWTLIPGNVPVPWLQTPVVNTFALIFVALWASVGVATLIISASVKNVPAELLEAASIDGAGALRRFFSIVLPSITPAVIVVLTTAVIFSLKVFDIVYVMTNGNFGTDTFANRLYGELFAANNPAHASAIAVLMLVAAIPVIVLNVREFEREQEHR